MSSRRIRVVKKNRDAFVDVTNGVPREEALIASATMTHSDADDQCGRSTRASGYAETICS
jgi:hypothetical protein